MEILGVQEFSDTAKGIEALDAMVKAAPVEIVDVRTITPARLVIFITGDVASVEASLVAGRLAGATGVVDELCIANLHAQVMPAMTGDPQEGEWDALGIVESSSITAGIEAADRAAKRAEVRLVELRIDSHLGGRSALKIVGRLEDVEASMAAAVSAVETRGRLVRSVVIPRPHPDIRPFYRATPDKETR